jgi:3-oxoacyl-[acyl-carrier-protein] synthase-3
LREHEDAVGIVGTGSYIPSTEVPNHVVAAWTGVSEEWIVRKTGIHKRWYAAEYEATSDLAVRAAEAALAAAGIDPGDLSYVVVATSTPDYQQPATACLVQHQIGATRAAAFDVNSVCSGFVVALVTAARLISGAADSRYALVIGADTFSRVIDRSDRKTAVLFGDAAGAVVLGPVPPGKGLLGAHLASYGEHHAMIRVEAGGSRVPASEKSLAAGQHFFRMDGRGVREFVSAEVPGVVGKLLAQHGIDAAAVDHVIPHQANAVLLRELLPRLALPRARMLVTVSEHGNTSAASIPLALDTARRRGVFADGELLLLAGFGGGMSIATALVTWAGTGASARNGDSVT